MAYRSLTLLAGSAALAVSLLGSDPAHADQTTVAVAANFTAAANDIAKAFQETTGYTVTYSFGATEDLFTQITQEDAPFEAFLAADQEWPERTETGGFGVAGTRFTYAKGRLVLWSADPNLIHDNEAILSDPAIQHVAIADPASGPYGAGAVEAMKTMGVYDLLQDKIVKSDTVVQAYQTVASGQADLGFVALSQVFQDHDGSRYNLPDGLYTTIRQDAILLDKGKESAAAKAFLAFLKSPKATAIIESRGYRIGD